MNNMTRIYTLNAGVMNYPFELVRLHEFVKEIHNYYKLNNELLSEPFSLSKAMVSFGMAGLSDADLDSLIRLLVQDGHLLCAADNTLSFPLSFIEGDC